mgnify:CR=1 FL=1
MKILSFVILTVISTFCWADSEKPTADKSLGDTLRFRIEIPAGTKQKWEFNDETGEMEKKELYNFFPTPEIMDLFQKPWRVTVTPSM